MERSSLGMKGHINVRVIISQRSGKPMEAS